MGRSLRFIEGKTAKIINLYIRNTQDESWLKKRQKVILILDGLIKLKKLYEYKQRTSYYTYQYFNGSGELYFLTSTESYQSKLYDYFKVRYTSSEIIEALHELEEAYMIHEYEKEKQIIEIEEDFV